MASLASLLVSATLACSAGGGASPTPHGDAGSAGTMTSGGASATGGSSGNGGSATSGGSGGASTGGVSGGAGSGSTGGSGSSGDAGSSGSGGGSTGPGPCPADAFFCTGFEEAGIPEGLTYQPPHVANNWADHMAFQTSVVNFGAQALEVKNTGEYWAMLSLPVPAQTFWVRLYMRSSEDWGQDGHNSFFMAMTGNGDQNGGDNMEVSEQFCQPVLNLHDSIATSVGGMHQCGTGTGPLAKDTWRCVEAFFDGAAGTYQVFADNQPIIDKSGWTTLLFQTFSFGYVNFHGPQRTMWYDDLVLAPNRIGCP